MESSFCRKVCYASRKLAKKRLRELKKIGRSENDTYYCRKCKAWHLTSKDKESTRGLTRIKNKEQMREDYALIRLENFLKNKSPRQQAKYVLDMLNSKNNAKRLNVGMKIMEGDRKGVATLYCVSVRNVDRWIEAQRNDKDDKKTNQGAKS